MRRRGAIFRPSAEDGKLIVEHAGELVIATDALNACQFLGRPDWAEYRESYFATSYPVSAWRLGEFARPTEAW